MVNIGESLLLDSPATGPWMVITDKGKGLFTYRVRHG